MGLSRTVSEIDGGTGPTKKFDDISSRLDTMHQRDQSTDQGHLVAVVFWAAGKGSSVSAVVQLISDYCLPSFFLI